MTDMKRIPSPLSWFGSKSRLATKITSLFPSHDTYVEPFAGSASVLLSKAPAMLEVINDIDHRVTNFFSVLRDPRRSAKLVRLLEVTPYSRSEFQAAKEPTDDSVESARRFLILSRQSYAGKLKEWKYSIPRAHPPPTRA